MSCSSSRWAGVLPLLLSTAVFTSDAGKEPVHLDPPQATVAREHHLTPLKYDPVVASRSAEKELTLQPAKGELSSQLTCAARPEREVAGSYSCVPYSWGWKCFHPDRCCYFFYTGGVYCYSYADQNGW